MQKHYTIKRFCTGLLKNYSHKKDHLISGFLKQGWARFVFSDVSQTLSDVSSRFSIERNDKKEELGIAFNTSLIMNSFLHGEERIKLICQYETDNILTSIYSESISNGEIRGFLEDNEIKEKSTYSDFLKIGKILYNHYQEVSGIIKLQSNKLTSEDIFNYFELSEQIRTHVFFHNNFTEHSISQGFILQKMPDCDLNKLSKLFTDIKENPSFQSIQNEGLSADKVYKIFNDLNLEVECKRTPIQFFCRCSIAQFMKTLKGLGKETILDMREKNQRTLTCQLCRNQYILKDVDFDNLITSFREEQTNNST